jgi:hypothetical protein
MVFISEFYHSRASSKPARTSSALRRIAGFGSRALQQPLVKKSLDQTTKIVDVNA